MHIQHTKKNEIAHLRMCARTCVRICTVSAAYMRKFVRPNVHVLAYVRTYGHANVYVCIRQGKSDAIRCRSDLPVYLYMRAYARVIPTAKPSIAAQTFRTLHTQVQQNTLQLHTSASLQLLLSLEGLIMHLEVHIKTRFCQTQTFKS